MAYYGTAAADGKRPWAEERGREKVAAHDVLTGGEEKKTGETEFGRGGGRERAKRAQGVAEAGVSPAHQRPMVADCEWRWC
ncbi:hypothetical protein E2562_025111 [Oryza meyeriana var. granulata]|uniref:Uncharacterized protein n=1 Tax=Oryza meyeriana var. granulata TaxID=110450 RepID=A0A6G1CI95_9ORYZ|nr:hypothetical protein E2562_025111 [Oryza meyeriana var. granulata]